eukprot:FR741088.1.p1 GENE.FR741088.1~~FR741088.1.p1  ORF type:complete len:254 (+),score=12.48 FR741088.1:107-868(+)
MLRNVLILSTTSGLPLFSKEFLNAVAQPRLIGSLLTAMMEWAVRTVGMPVTYIELSNVAVTIVRDEVAKVCCALFHDRSDGAAFGKLVAYQILYAFLEEYSGEVMGLGPNLKDFHGFHVKIAGAVRSTIRPVLNRLQGHRSRAIQKVMLVTEDDFVHTGSNVDQLALLANLQALLNFASELLAQRDDACTQIVIEGRNDARTLLWRIERAVFIVVVTKAVRPVHYRGALDEAAKMLRAICFVMSQHLLTRSAQ